MRMRVKHAAILLLSLASFQRPAALDSRLQGELAYDKYDCDGSQEQEAWKQLQSKRIEVEERQAEYTRCLSRLHEEAYFIARAAEQWSADLKTQPRPATFDPSQRSILLADASRLLREAELCEGTKEQDLRWLKLPALPRTWTR